MNITVVGGGNIGTQFAVHCAEKGHCVTIYTSTPQLFSPTLTIVDEKGNVTHTGRINRATSDPEIAFKHAEMIFVTMPATMMRSIALVIREYTGTETVIGVVPGNGGGECAFKECIERGNPFFGLERVPAIARLVLKGRCVRSTGYRRELHLSALPRRNATIISKVIEAIFDQPCKVIPDYLNLTMTPSNPILHTCRLRTIFSDWHEGVTYSSIPLFYEDWNDASSELMIQCDAELQRVCHALTEIDLSHVISLKDHYESYSVHDMTKKLSSIPAFRGIQTPAMKVGERWIPDFQSRYFTADFSFGLAILQQIARFAGVETPKIDSTMAWYRSIAKEKDHFSYADYGITDRESFIRFYSK